MSERERDVLRERCIADKEKVREKLANEITAIEVHEGAEIKYRCMRGSTSCYKMFRGPNMWKNREKH